MQEERSNRTDAPLDGADAPEETGNTPAMADAGDPEAVSPRAFEAADSEASSGPASNEPIAAEPTVASPPPPADVRDVLFQRPTESDPAPEYPGVSDSPDLATPPEISDSLSNKAADPVVLGTTPVLNSTQPVYPSPIQSEPLAQKAPEAEPEPTAAESEKPAPAASKKRKGLLEMQPSEEVVCEVDSGNDGRFVLTSSRLIYQGQSSEGALFSAASVSDVTSIEFGRRSRSSGSAWWGVVGLIAAVAVWQVTTNERVGAVTGAAVAVISLLLLADYWFRPAGLTLRFGTPGGTVEGPVSGKRVRDAEDLAARVQEMKSTRQPHTGESTATPPGGSPGL